MLLPPTASPHSAVGVHQAGRVLTPTSGRVPAPAHSPVAARTLLRKTALGTPGCTPTFTLCSHPRVKAADMPCPSEGAAGKLCSKACAFSLHCTNCESPPDRCYWLWDVPALGDHSKNHSCIALQQDTYPVKGCEVFSPGQLSSVLTPQTAFNLPLTSLLSPWCLQAVPSTLLCFAEELLLGRAVSLQHCLLAMSSFQPRSPAQLSSRGSAQCVTFSAPSGLRPGVPGAPGEPAGQQAEAITDVPSHSWGEMLLSAVTFLLCERVRCKNHLLIVPSLNIKHITLGSQDVCLHFQT